MAGAVSRKTTLSCFVLISQNSAIQGTAISEWPTVTDTKGLCQVHVVFRKVKFWPELKTQRRSPCWLTWPHKHEGHLGQTLWWLSSRLDTPYLPTSGDYADT